MNLRDLEYVVAVADHGHFGRAAAACNVSQPTLSGQILKLEAELGLRLFEREGRRARVSDRAQAVVAQARATLAAAAGVTEAALAARDPFVGPLRLGMIATVAPYLLPIALKDAIAALPMTPLHLVEDLTDRLLAKLNEGALDGAVIATDPEGDRLTAIALYDEPFFLVFGRGAGKDAAPRSASTRSIRARSCCSPKAIACAIRRSTCAAGRRRPRSARTCGRPASRRCAIWSRPGRARRWRRCSPTRTGGAWAPDSTGSRLSEAGPRARCGSSSGAARRAAPRSRRSRRPCAGRRKRR